MGPPRKGGATLCPEGRRVSPERGEAGACLPGGAGQRPARGEGCGAGTGTGRTRGPGGPGPGSRGRPPSLPAEPIRSRDASPSPPPSLSSAQPLPTFTARAGRSHLGPGPAGLQVGRRPEAVPKQAALRRLARPRPGSPWAHQVLISTKATKRRRLGRRGLPLGVGLVCGGGPHAGTPRGAHAVLRQSKAHRSPEAVGGLSVPPPLSCPWGSRTPGPGTPQGAWGGPVRRTGPRRSVGEHGGSTHARGAVG